MSFFQSTERSRFADSPVTSHDARPINALAYHDICCTAIFGRACSALQAEDRRLFHYSWKACSNNIISVATRSFGSCSDRVVNERVELEAGKVYTGCYHWQRGVEGRSPSMLQSWSNVRRFDLFSLTSTLEVDSPVLRFAGVPICCVETLEVVTLPVRRFAGILIYWIGAPANQLPTLTSTLEVDSPVRRFAGVPICCVERWKLIRRFSGVSRFAGMPGFCCVETLEVVTLPVRRFAGILIYWFGTLEVHCAKQ